MQINVNNINLFYTCQGSGEPLIMLHGNGEDHTIFDGEKHGSYIIHSLKIAEVILELCEKE